MRSAISAGSIGTPLWRAADRAVGAVDLDDDFGFFAVVLLGGGDQRRLDALEDDLFVDILIAMDRVDDAKQFVGVHSLSLSLELRRDTLHAPLDPHKTAETLQNLTTPLVVSTIQ